MKTMVHKRKYLTHNEIRNICLGLYFLIGHQKYNKVLPKTSKRVGHISALRTTKNYFDGILELEKVKIEQVEYILAQIREKGVQYFGAGELLEGFLEGMTAVEKTLDDRDRCGMIV